MDVAGLPWRASCTPNHDSVVSTNVKGANLLLLLLFIDDQPWRRNYGEEQVECTKAVLESIAATYAAR